jgi:hypothetical protein
MKQLKNVIKCGIENKCLDDSVFRVLTMYKIRGTIISYLTVKKTIPNEILQIFYKSYKKFARSFFNKTTVNCIKDNCSKYLPKNTRFINPSLKKIGKLKMKLKGKRDILSRNYIKILKLVEKIANDFSKKYDKKYLH